MFRLAILLITVLSSFSFAQERDPWIGKRVFIKEGAVAKVGNETIDRSKLSSPSTVGDVNGDWLWLGRAWVQKKDVMEAQEALDFYTEKIRLNPSDSRSWYLRACVWSEKGEVENAIKDGTEAIRLDPKKSVAYAGRAADFLSKGELDAAIRDATEAIRLDPKSDFAYQSRGASLISKGDVDAAIKDYTEAIRLDPKSDFTYGSRGRALQSKGDIDAALKDYTEAIRLNPKDADWSNALAWLCSTCPDEKYCDGKKAIELATKACELSAWKTWNHVGTLGAAYAESGDWENAIKYQEKAIEMATDEKDKVGGRERLELYKNKQPYRQEIKKK